MIRQGRARYEIGVYNATTLGLFLGSTDACEFAFKYGTVRVSTAGQADGTAGARGRAELVGAGPVFLRIGFSCGALYGSYIWCPRVQVDASVLSPNMCINTSGVAS